MKKMFSVEIEEDNAKLEQYRQLVAPGAAAEPSVRRSAAASNGAPAASAASSRAAAPPPKAAAGPAARGEGMEWDDEELDTQIFDKDEPIEAEEAEGRTLAADDLFFEDDDRTVANEPPPDVLEQARPPGHAGAPRLAPAPAPVLAAAPAPRPAPAPAKQTLLGMPSPNLPSPLSRPGAAGPAAAAPPSPGAPHMGPPPGLAGLRRSGFNVPAPVLPPPTAPPQPVFSFDAPKGAFNTGAFNSGGFTAAPPARASKAGRTFVLAVLAAGVIGGTVYWYQSVNKPGQLQVATVPADATVLVDNAKVGDHSPLTIEKAPGSYTLSVTKDGYVRSDQNVEIRAGQPVALNIALEPSPDTGFELSSDPPGGLVWLDGNPISGPNGQARTDFRAYRIPPGHHVLEIKGESRYRPWRQDIEVEPGQIRKIRATLIPSADGAGTRVAAREEKPADKPKAEPPPVAAAEPPKAEPPKAEPPKAEPPKAEPPVHTTPAVASTGAKKKKKSEAAIEEPFKDTPAPKAAEPAAGECFITIGSRPWAEVWIDGKNTNKHTPFADYKIACGKHKIVFKRPDLQIDQTESITVSPGEKFKQSYSLMNDSE
jgi:hypothetical protein